MFVSEIVGLLLSLAVSQTVTVGMATRISVQMYALKYVKSSKWPYNHKLTPNATLF